jgi:aminomethyltransferase
VARRLVGLTVAGDEVPAAGAPLQAGEKEAGKIRSAAWSPTLGHAIALAYVHRDCAEPGTELRVGDATAVVTALPFVPPA